MSQEVGAVPYEWEEAKINTIFKTYLGNDSENYLEVSFNINDF